MPTLDIDMFDDAPKVGDEIKVMGEVKSINEETGKVEVSYDDASIVEKSKKKKKKRSNRREFVDDEIIVREGNPPPEMMPQSQTLDEALAQSFPTTQ